MFCLYLFHAAAIEMATTSEWLFPRPHPHAFVSQVIGTTEVSIEYHRPQVKNRKIWGDTVPFGKIWRTGAHEATIFKLGDNAKISGNPVPAGTYALFAIPGPENWTLVLNKKWQQLGAYEYQQKEDLLRFEVRPKAMKEHTEYLTYVISPASPSSAYVDLLWEKLRVSFLIDVDVNDIVSTRMKKVLAKSSDTDWKLLCDAARYLVENEREIPQAMAWIDKSIKINENANNLYVKAKILKQMGRNHRATHVAEKALKTATLHGEPGSVTGPIQSMLEQLKNSK